MKNRTSVYWALHHTWAIVVSYIAGMIALLLIHGALGYSMNDDGSWLSNALMHVANGALLGLGTGLLQRKLLKKYVVVTRCWILALVAGFVIAETIAGIVLWRLGIYRGLINLFNADNHFPEAAIFAFAGLIAGLLQFRMLKPVLRNAYLWILASALGWALFILSSYIAYLAFPLGALLYGTVTGVVFHMVLSVKLEGAN